MPFKPSAKITNVINRDKKIILSTTREDFPFAVDHGQGDYIYDIADNRFIDFSSFVGVYTLGVNANTQIRNAAKNQIDKLMHPAFLDFYSELPVRFAEKFMEFMPPGFGRVFYSNSGTEANEDAMKLSKIFTKRNHIIAFYNSFHGRSFGSMALTATKTIHHAHYGPLVNVSHAPYPNPYRCKHHSDDPEECSKESIEFIETNIIGRQIPPEEIGAIFFEPVQGEGGYVIPPHGFFKQLRELADKYGMLLVDDEIQAGYMRTGKFLALDNFGVKADIYTFAKALAGGLPIGLTVSRHGLGDVTPGAHAGTFGGNLVSVAAAIASLDYVKRNKQSLEAQVKSKGKKVMKRLYEMKDRYEMVGDVRGLGLMTAAEFVKSKVTKEYASKERDQIISYCFNNGLLILPCGKSTIRLIPPITISESNLEKGLDIFEEAVKKNASK